MDKKLRRDMAVVGLLLMLSGCAPAGGVPSPNPVQQLIHSWPHNAYTQMVPQPAHGAPMRVIRDERAGFYAIFLEDITRQQGEAYLDDLRAQGFERQIGDRNGVAIGQLWTKGTVTVSVSISDQTLGLYIHLDTEA